MNSVDIVKTEADMSMLNTSISVGKINLKETNTSACYLLTNGITLVKMNSVDIVKTEADMSMLNTSISVGKITEKETNTSACYTGIILVKMN